MNQGSDKIRAFSCLGGCEVTDHSDDPRNGKEGTEESHVAAVEVVSGCEGHGNTNGAGMALGLVVGPSAEAASQEDTWKDCEVPS